MRYENLEYFSKIIKYLRKYTEVVVIEGIEKKEQLKLNAQFSECWLQGYAFESTDIANFERLPPFISTHSVIDHFRQDTEQY